MRAPQMQKVQHNTDAPMLPDSQSSASPHKPITKMASSNQIEAVVNRPILSAQAVAAFHTPLIRRKFRKNFYRWSLRLMELEAQVRNNAALHQACFCKSLDELRQQLEPQGYTQWCDIKPKPTHEDLLVILSSPASVTLKRTFETADRFMSPIYCAFFAEKVSKDEFERLKSQVELRFETLRQSLDELLTHSKIR